MSVLDRCHNIADLRLAARRRLPRGIFEFVDRGAEDEIALANNTSAFRRIVLKPKVLVDVSRRTTATQLFGKPASMPVAIAPTGLAGLCWYEGELSLARAAAAAGIPLALSMGAITSMEQVAEAGCRLWFQLNIWPDRVLMTETIMRARQAGAEALIVTVDSAVAGKREYNERNGFRIPFQLSVRSAVDILRHPRWFAGVILKHLATTGMPRHENHPQRYRTSILEKGAHGSRTDNVTWDEIRRLREEWPGTFIAKGVLTPEDAEQAARIGADGIVVSNHGGRHLDSAPAPIEMVGAVASAVGARCTVMLDSGVRRGGDIAKAIAVGAKAVLVGRATLYGVSAAGEAGATKALDILREELDRTMAYLGCTSIDALDAGALISDLRRH